MRRTPAAAGWRVALVTGRRDAARARARTGLILLLIGLPVAVLVAALTFTATADVDPREALPATVGTTQARIIPQGSTAVVQDAAGTGVFSPETAAPVAGHENGEPWTPAELAVLTGGSVRPTALTDLPLRVGERWLRARTVVMSGADLVSSGLGTLVSGRLPAGPGEVAVTAAGLGQGLPGSGALSLSAPDGTRIEARVVGTVTVVAVGSGPVDLVAPDPRLNPADPAFLLDRPQPVSWAEVRRLNAYGLAVVSRTVVEDPPPAAQLDPEVRRLERGSWPGRAIGALVVVGVIAETTLLAGPAFAVSAARRRRSLALLAAQGADPRQVRRFVLAEALVLGAPAAAAGAVLGIVGVAAALAVARVTGLGVSVGPFDVPWLRVAGVVVLAVLAAVVAALLPARGATRLDNVGVLSGRGPAGRPRRGHPALGLGIAVLATAAILVLTVGGSERGRHTWVGYVLAGGTLVVLLGALLCVPAVLALLARTLGRTGVALRLAARDSVRQRSRAVPAVAAIMAACAAMTVLGISSWSGRAQDERTYVATAPDGSGTVRYAEKGSDGAGTVAEIRRQHPDWVISTWDQVGSSSTYALSAEDTQGPRSPVAVVAPGCTERETLEPLVSETRYNACHRVGTDGLRGPIFAAPTTAADPAASLSVEQARTLQAGGVLVADASLIDDGRVRLAVGRTSGTADDDLQILPSVTLPAVAVEPDLLTRAVGDETLAPGAWLLPETVARAALPATPWLSRVVNPGGPISAADQQAVNERSDPRAGLGVERGYQPTPDATTWMLFLVAGVLVAVAALVVTALSQAEARADLATLAALGSTVGLRRRVAAAQAGLVAITGAGLGTLVGLPAGVALAVLLTTEASGLPGSVAGPPLVVFPWGGFALLLLAVPASAAAVAALAVRRVPTLTRRLD